MDRRVNQSLAGRQSRSGAGAAPGRPACRDALLFPWPAGHGIISVGGVLSGLLRGSRVFQSVAIPAAASRFTGPFAMAEPKYVVRYGRMRTLGEFRSLAELDCARGDQVLIRTERGTELGEVLCPVSERTTLYMGSSPRGEILPPGDAG